MTPRPVPNPDVALLCERCGHPGHGKAVCGFHTCGCVGAPHPIPVAALPPDTEWVQWAQVVAVLRTFRDSYPPDANEWFAVEAARLYLEKQVR